MKRMEGHLTTLGIALLLCAGTVEAAPIVYSGTLPGSGIPVADVNTQAQSSEDDPVGAEYWSFLATSGNSITVFGDRLAGHYDMFFWIFEGLFADESDFGASFDTGDTGFIAFGDDEDPPNIAGPFGDPNITFLAPSTGFYTVAVTNFLSSAGPPNPFQLTANNINAVPEPASMLLLGSGLALAGAARRRARNRKI